MYQIQNGNEKHSEPFSGRHAILRDGGLNISTDTPYWNNQCLKFSIWKQETFSNIVNICLARTFELEKGKLKLDCNQNPTNVTERWSCGSSKKIARFYSKTFQGAIGWIIGKLMVILGKCWSTPAGGGCWLPDYNQSHATWGRTWRGLFCMKTLNCPFPYFVIDDTFVKVQN